MSYFVPWVNGKIRQDSVCNLIIVDGYHRSGGMAIMVSSQQWRMVDKMDLKGLHIGVKWCGQDARPELWPLGIAAQLGQHFGVLLQHIFGHGQRFLYIRKYIIVNSGVNGFKGSSSTSKLLDWNLSDGSVEGFGRFQQLQIGLLLAALWLIPGRVVGRIDLFLSVEEFVLIDRYLLAGRQPRVPVPDAAVQHLKWPISNWSFASSGFGCTAKKSTRANESIF